LVALYAETRLAVQRERPTENEMAVSAWQRSRPASKRCCSDEDRPPRVYSPDGIRRVRVSIVQGLIAAGIVILADVLQRVST